MWPIVMGWPHFSCTSHSAKDLSQMLTGAVLPCWQPHGHGQDGVTVLLPADLLQGAEGQHSRVG